jgi:hypothetical protein
MLYITCCLAGDLAIRWGRPHERSKKRMASACLWGWLGGMAGLYPCVLGPTRAAVNARSTVCEGHRTPATHRAHCFCAGLRGVMKTDEKPISIFCFYIFWWKRSGFGKYGFENEIEICGHTETNKYGWRARKLNYDHII